MKRRQAIQNIIIVSSGISLIPACKFSSGASYENLDISNEQLKFLDAFLEALLPREGTLIQTPETNTEFLLTMLNDCASEEDIQKFQTGLAEFQNYLQENYHSQFSDLDSETKLEILQYLNTSEKVTEPIKTFYNTSRRTAIQHFMGSAYYMVEQMGFEFAPGRYSGCVPV